MFDNWRERVRRLQRETYVLYLAYSDPRMPWYARVWVLIVLAYAVSPVDLIPDFIPVLGFLDDLLLVPMGIWVAVRLVPAEVMADCREQANEEMALGRGPGWAATVVVVGVWLALAAGLGQFLGAVLAL